MRGTCTVTVHVHSFGDLKVLVLFYEAIEMATYFIDLFSTISGYPPSASKNGSALKEQIHEGTYVWFNALLAVLRHLRPMIILRNPGHEFAPGERCVPLKLILIFWL